MLGRKLLYSYPVHDEGTDLSVDISFSFSTQIVKVIRIDIAHEEQVDDPCILSLGVVIEEVGLLDTAQTGHDAGDDLIDSYDLGNHGSQLREEGMIPIGAIIDLTSILFHSQQMGPGQLVELPPDSVGGAIELLGQLPEIGLGLGVEKQRTRSLIRVFEAMIPDNKFSI
jgi:hypothetical protein